MTISPAEEVWFVYVKFPYDEVLKNKIKGIPGSSWNPEKKAWRVPVEMVKWLKI